MRTHARLVLTWFLLAATACQPLVTPTPEATATKARAVATAIPKDAATPATPSMAATPDSQPASTPALTAGDESGISEASSGPLPAPSLFDLAWQDRSPFQAGLVPSSQAALEQLAGATVYHLDFTIDDNLQGLHGRLELLYTNQEAGRLEEVIFRLFPNLTGGSILIADLAVNGQPVEPTYQLADSVMAVPISPPLSPGQRAVIAMDFAVTIPTDESSNYGTFAFLDNVLALAHFYPMIPVYDDEGWNVEIPTPAGDVVYADASLYLVRVTAPAGLTIVASGTTLNQAEREGWQTLTIAAGPARDFYLAASDGYRVLSRSVGETTINSYAFADLDDGSQLALDSAVTALAVFADHFGPYPYTEFDLVGTGTNALGVEYPGIVAITHSIYQGDRLSFLESTVTHEAAHQWFYNVVGNDQLDEPWIDEALAQYANLLYFQSQYGQAGYDGFRQSLTGRWDRVEGADIPIGLPVAAYEGREYGAIVYGRGPLFLEQLAEAMGQATFDAFLRDYYDTFQWGIATTEGLKALAEAHCGCDLTALFEAWVYEK